MKASEDTIIKQKGRPKGGIGWLIKDTINLIIEFKNDRISTMKIWGKDYEIVIIGVYLTANGTNQALENLKQDIATVKAIIEINKKTNIEIIIMGDLNCYPIRKNRHDKELVKMLEEMNLECLNLKFCDINSHTFEGNGKSWIDHIIAEKKQE